MASTRILPRLRVAALAVLMAATSFAVNAAPVSVPPSASDQQRASAPLPFGLGPQVAHAAYCASGPLFTGKLTQQLVNSGTPSTAFRITSNTVYGWLSNINQTWSCTLYRRYSGLVWNTTASLGMFDYGTLINNTSMACNLIVGTTDYLKANNSAVCPPTDTSNVLSIQLTAERIYQADVNHNSIGDFSFVHSDCDTTPYYGSESIRPSDGLESHAVAFTTTITGNRPGANCDPITIDSTGTSQTVVYDKTAPATAFTTPAPGGTSTTANPAATVVFEVNDSPTGSGGNAGVASWTLQREVAPETPATPFCGTWGPDAGAGAVVTGTSAGSGQTSAQTLPSGSCYRWTLTAADANGNASAAITSGVIRRDVSALLGSQGYQRFESWSLGGGDSLTVNAATGNAVVSHPVVSLPIRGGTVSVSLAYNSQDPVDIGMGSGWRLNTDRRLENPVWGSNVTFAGADGARYAFTWVPATSSYQRPDTIYADLTQSGSGFRLTYRDGSYDQFDSGGLLAEERDRYGNGVSINRTVPGQVSLVDSAAGRSIVIAYASGRPVSVTDWAYLNAAGEVQATATGRLRKTCLFYDVSNRLSGWIDPLYSPTSACPSSLPTASHATGLAYANGLLASVSKSQTVETLSGGVLGTTTHYPVTAVVYRGGDVAAVADAVGVTTTLDRTALGEVAVTRGPAPEPIAATKYALVAPGDSLARVSSVKRLVGGSWTEQLTQWADAASIPVSERYPVEVWKVTENNGGTPSRTVTTTYAPNSKGLVVKVVEPLDGYPTHDRWTEYTYNGNGDVTSVTVRQANATDDTVPLRSVTVNCWASYTTTPDTQDQRLCPAGTGLYLVRTIQRYVAGGAVNADTNIATETAYDIWGRRTRETRHNHDAAGAPLSDLMSGWTHDALGATTSSVANWGDGVVTTGSDLAPDSSTHDLTDLTTVYGHDTAGNQIAVADPRRAIEVALSTSLGPDDYSGSTVYDALGHAVRQTLPTTPVARGGVGCAPDPACRQTTSVYDELGNLREARSYAIPSGAAPVTATAYDPCSRAVATFEDPDGPGGTDAYLTGGTVYLDASRTVTTRSQEQIANDGLGSTVAVSDQLGHTVIVTEAAGTTLGVASETTTAYDALGRTTTTVVGANGDSPQTTTSAYDLGGRVVSTDDGFACTASTYVWDHIDKVKTGLDGGTCLTSGTTHWRETQHIFDALGRETVVAQSDAWDDVGNGDLSSATVYDALGSVRDSSSYATGTSTRTGSTFTVNRLGQIVKEERYHTVSGTRTVDSTAKTVFDPVGNAADACFWKVGAAGDCLPAGTTPWISPPATVTSTAYDGRSSRIAQTTAAPDGSGLPGTTLYNPAADYQPSVTYQPTKVSNNVVVAEVRTTYTYETSEVVRRSRLVGQTTELCSGAPAGGHPSCAGSTLLGSVVYAYDANDNISKVVEDNGSGPVTRCYEYDGRGQLILEQAHEGCTPTLADESYAYDATGNITAATGGGLQTTYTYAQAPAIAAPILVSTQALTVTADSAGLTTRVTGGASDWAYLYDAEGRLTSACRSTSCSGTGLDRADYAYDGVGHRTRITTTLAGVTSVRNIAYSGDAPAQETDGAGAVLRTYVTDETGRITRFCDPDCTGSHPQYLVAWCAHGDALSVSEVDPATGAATVANRYAYQTWGRPTTTTANGYPDLGFRYLWVGASDVQWDDSAGEALYYMHARSYSPALGRFLQPDPARADGSLYAYAGNSPATKSDPSGLAPNRGQCWHGRCGRLIWTVVDEYTWWDAFFWEFGIVTAASFAGGFVAGAYGVAGAGTATSVFVGGAAWAAEKDRTPSVGSKRIAKIYQQWNTVTVLIRYYNSSDNTTVDVRLMTYRGTLRCANAIKENLMDAWNDDMAGVCGAL
jgi:RHS repeat-associated protein